MEYLYLIAMLIWIFNIGKSLYVRKVTMIDGIGSMIICVLFFLKLLA